MAEGWSTYQINNDSLDLFDIFEAPLWHQISKKNSSINGCWFFYCHPYFTEGHQQGQKTIAFLLCCNGLHHASLCAINIWLSGSLV